MPRPSKGPRLYLRRGRKDRRTGRPLPDVWVIRDGACEISTGAARDDLARAEEGLATYLGAKHLPDPKDTRVRDPGAVTIAEVLAYYLEHKTLKSPATAAYAVARLCEWWGDRVIADVKRSTCEAYVAARMQQRNPRATRSQGQHISDQTAGRELSTLSAAIGFWHQEFPLAFVPSVVLPARAETDKDALTRGEVARMLWATLGWRWNAAAERFERLPADIRLSVRANRAHLRRALLIGIYNGARPGVIRALSWLPSPTHPYVDLEDDLIYRRGRKVRESKTKRTPIAALPERLAAHLRRWQRLDETGKRPSQWVIHHGGEPLAGPIRTGFEGLARDGGLTRRPTPHFLRHTCCTWLAERDVPPWEAAGYAGMTMATFERVYGHRRPSHQKQARTAIDRR